MKIHTLKLELSENDDIEIVEIKNLKQATALNVNENFFLLFKALQFNDLFNQEIIRIRKKHNINIKGFYYKNAIYQIREVFRGDKDKPLTVRINRVKKDCSSIVKHFRYKNTDDFKRIMPEAIAQIVIYNAVIMGNYDSIRLYNDEVIDKESGIPEIHIVIGADTSRRSLNEFIDKKWEQINKIQKSFLKPISFKISERDLTVFDLIKHKHYKLFQTLDELENIYPNQVFNYDQIKASHKNAKDKITSLFKK